MLPNIMIIGNIVSMTIFDRQLHLDLLLKKKNLFLFGPRATGKTFLLKQQLPDAAYYDLLDADVFGRLSRRPKIIARKGNRRASSSSLMKFRSCPRFSTRSTASLNRKV